MRVVEEGGVRFVEGMPKLSLMRGVEDAGLVIEACFSAGVQSALLYAENLTGGFFDLSSGEAGAVLQKLRIGQCTVQFKVRRDGGGGEQGEAAREWLGSI